MSAPVKLGDVCQINWGDTSKTKAAYTEAGFPAFSASGRDGYMPHFDHEGPGIVLSAIGAKCGKTWYTDGKWSCIKNTILLKTNPAKADTRYIYYATQLPDIWPIRGAAQPFISQKDARGVEIDLPDIPTQRRIAGILSAYDDLIENNLRRIRILEEMAQSLYREWFVHFRIPPEVLQKAGLPPEITLVDSPLGPIPDGWEVEELGEVALVRWGDTSTTKKSYVEEGFPAYSAAGQDGQLDHFDHDRTGIVLSAIGANCGRTWLATGKWSCIKNTICLWSSDPTVSTEFLFLATFGQESWPKRGAAQPFISQGDAKRMQFVIPPSCLCEKATKIFSSAFSLKQTLLDRNQTLRQTRNLLLPKLLSPS